MKKIIAKRRYKTMLNKIEAHRCLDWLKSTNTPELMKVAADCPLKNEAAILRLSDAELEALIRGEPCPQFDKLLKLLS